MRIGWVNGRTNKLLFHLPHGLQLNKDCQDNAVNLSTTTRKKPWRETLAAYHFRGRAGSEIEFFQMQEEAFQLSDQQQEDDAVCKLWCCMSVLAIPTARYEHLVPSWTLCRVGPSYRKSITGGGSLAPSYWILTMMYTAVLYRILLPPSYSVPACGVKQRDQA